MYRNTFQGGSCVEVLNAVNIKLSSQWFIAKSVRKEFDKLAKTYVYVLKGEAIVQQMWSPKDKSKKSLGLTQHHLVFQLYHTAKDRFSIDIRITCISGCHKRITLLTHKKELQNTTLSAAVPIDIPDKSVWVHLCVNLQDLASLLWNESFKCIDSLSLSGSCLIRQIYTVHESLIDQKDFETSPNRYLNMISKSCRFPLKVDQKFHLVSEPYLSRLSAVNTESDTHHCIPLPESVRSHIQRKKPSSIASGSTVSQKSSRGSTRTFLLKGHSSSELSTKSGSSRANSSSTLCSAQRKLRVSVSSGPVDSNPPASVDSDKLESSDNICISLSPVHDLDYLNVPGKQSHHNTSCVSETLPEERVNDDIFSRYRQRSVWLPPSSPVSKALSISRAIARESKRQQQNEPETSVTGVWKNFLSEHQDLLNTSCEDSPELPKAVSYKNPPTYDSDLLCPFHKQQYRNRFAKSCHSLAADVDGIFQNTHVHRPIHSADSIHRCKHSSSQLNSTYTLNMKEGGGILDHCYDADTNKPMAPYKFQPFFHHSNSKMKSTCTIGGGEELLKSCPHREINQFDPRRIQSAHSRCPHTHPELNSTYTLYSRDQLSHSNERHENVESWSDHSDTS